MILGESASWYIRLDAYPANPGHVELVTKRHVESFFALDGDESAELYGVLAYARDLVAAKWGAPDGWTIGINDGRAAGRSIDHLHVHLIPRHHGALRDQITHDQSIKTNVAKANEQLNKIVGNHPTDVVRTHMDVATVYMFGALVSAVQDLTAEIAKSREAQ
jgi:diadenosine tetraphosphate (Ap4A) HIT family hydrolase